MHKSIITILTFLFFTVAVLSQDIKKQYIEDHKLDAAKKMKEYGIPASIILAQAIIESGAGRSYLAQNSNNHFGIKCHNTWSGQTFIMDDDSANECFRKYKSVTQSYDDYALFLSNRDRYAFLFEIPVTDYNSWAHGLKKAGYATNPQYAYMLIKIIEDYDLANLDKIKRLSELNEEKVPIALIKSSSKYPEYLDKDSEDFHPISISSTNRIIYETNSVKYVLALKYDSWNTIAEELDMYARQLINFNSANKKTTLNPGDRVYIENKRRKAEVMYHIIQQDETLRNISQKYAVRDKLIRKNNKIKRNENLIAGQRLKLR